MREFWEKRWQSGTGPPDAAQQAKLRVLQEGFPSDVRTMLDVGCGNGWLLEGLRGRYRLGVGVDQALEGLRHVKAPSTAGLCAALPFRDRSFDLLLCAELVEHLEDAALASALREMARVTRRYLLVTTPYQENLALGMSFCPRCRRPFHSSLHVRSFTESGLRETVERAGFRSIWIRRAGKSPARSALLSRMSGSLAGYYPCWRPGMICPFCAGPIPRKRARENPLSLLLESLQAVVSSLAPKPPHSICALFEKTKAG